MWNSIKNRIRHYMTRRKWRKDNAHNGTYMGGYFNIKTVSVGKETYGLINIINHNEKNRLIIGNYCSIAPDVVFVLSGEHPLNHISTFPFKTHTIKCQKYEAESNGDIIVEDDVWIGTGAKIMSGVHIHQGAVIAAGAVVTKDVCPYEVVGGVPAKLLKKRFNQNIIDELLRVDYAALDRQEIEEHINDLYVPLTCVEQLSWMPKRGDK